DIVNLLTSEEAGRQPKPGFERPARADAPRIEQSRLAAGLQQFDTQRAGKRLVTVVGDNSADRCDAARQVFLLADNMDHRPPEDIRNRLRAGDSRSLLSVKREAVSKTVPDEIVHGDGIGEL